MMLEIAQKLKIWNYTYIMKSGQLAKKLFNIQHVCP
jgi:hypothetical protein